jgi:predicted membrane channel-forming protein YqfA (hemolysin III family)
LFSLVISKNQKTLKRWEFTFLLVSLFCALFGAVYEQFSHGVYSNYMLYAFVIPLVGGTLAVFLLDFVSRKTMPGKTAFFLYSAGIAALTVGSIFEGALEIYGTTNKLIIVYPLVGLSLVFSSVVAYIIGALYVRRNFD